MHTAVGGTYSIINVTQTFVKYGYVFFKKNKNLLLLNLNGDSPGTLLKAKNPILSRNILNHISLIDTEDVIIKASAHSFKHFTSRLLKVSFSLSMHLLPRMNVMLDFIWTLSVQLPGTRNKWTLQKILIHGRIRTTNTAPLAFQRVPLTTRPLG